MVALLVHDSMQIESHKGPYRVNFCDDFADNITNLVSESSYFILDSNVADLYSLELDEIIKNENCLIVEATEENKSIEKIIPLIRKLLDKNLRRDHELIAIGGGIIQDITCFIATNMFRGITWTLIPTTLLAQADSCIGSKSSVNLGVTKNILGTFNPPSNIILSTKFLDTLEENDLLSGIGEIIKVHAIDGVDSFNNVSKDYQGIIASKDLLFKYIIASLEIKKRYIELDEFDQGPRNIFNYGHSFGHAIEAATHFMIPHGIAVTIGMDMANKISMNRGLISSSHYNRMSGVLRENYKNFSPTDIPFKLFYDAIMKDKKNTSTHLVLILPVGTEAEIQKVEISPDSVFKSQCENYLLNFSQ